MVYKLLLIFLTAFPLFPKDLIETGIYSEKEIINLIEKNKDFICQPSKKTFKIEGKNFIGHFNEDGKPYGEWSLKDRSIRQCFLENEEITDYKGNYFYKRNSHILLKITYEGTAHNIFITNKGRIKGYFFDKYEDRYVLRYGRILILKKIEPLYERMIIQ